MINMKQLNPVAAPTIDIIFVGILLKSEGNLKSRMNIKSSPIANTNIEPEIIPTLKFVKMFTRIKAMQPILNISINTKSTMLLAKFLFGIF